MTFLAPFALLLAAAAAVPLFLHLRRARVTRRIEFPAARYLVRATREHERSLRARSSLLALLRVAIVLALALAAARPLAPLGGGHGAAAVAIVIDDSPSAAAVREGRTVFDAHRDAARVLLGQLGQDDRAWLVLASGPTLGGDHARLRAALDTLGVSLGASDPAGAVRRAARLAAGAPPLAPAVLVATDAQRSSWPPGEGIGHDVPVAAYVPTGAPAPNAGVLGAEPVPLVWPGRGTVRATVRAPRAGDSLTAVVRIDDRVVARAVLTAGEGATAAVEIPVPSAPAGWSPARVELPRDELAVDDVRWFAVFAGAAPGVVANAGEFAASAVDALVAAGTLTSGPGTVIAYADMLDAPVARRPALVTAPADPTRIGGANRALARAGIPWRFGAERRTTARVRGEGLGDADVLRRYALAAEPGTHADTHADTLAAVGGEPWIVAGDGYVLVGSPFDTAATTLPLTPAFVPWLARAVVGRVAVGAPRLVAARPGDRVAAPAGVDGITVGGALLAARDSISVPARPGVYFLTRDGRRVGALVANIDPEESDVTRLDDAGLAERLGPGARVVHDPGDAARGALRGASRRPLGRMLAALAALFVAAEAVAGGSALRRRSAAATT